jgi:hypothetical protein
MKYRFGGRNGRNCLFPGGTGTGQFDVKTIKFGILADQRFPICEPLQELKALLRQGLLLRFASIWGELFGGDCSAVTLCDVF